MKKKILLTIGILLLFLVATKAGQNIWQAALMIPSLLPDNKTRPLEWFTRSSKIEAVEIPYKDGFIKADLYLPSNPQKILLAVHGANEQGKDDPRIVNFGNTFARAQIATLIPTFPNITREKFTPESAEEIKTAYAWLVQRFKDEKTGMMAFSVAAGPMFIAAADSTINEKVDYLISFGGYYETKGVLRNVTTGENRDPFGHELISEQYAKFFGPNEQLDQLLSNTDPAKFDELFDALPLNIKQFITDLTPAQHLDKIKADKIFIVHSDPDYIIPVSESEKLKQALGDKAELTILKSFSHVNVQFARPTLKNLINYYLPETAKLYGLIFRILSF